MIGFSAGYFVVPCPVSHLRFPKIPVRRRLRGRTFIQSAKVDTVVYTNYVEVMDVQTAKLFASGKSQAVRLPKEFRFTGTEVGISKFGQMVVLFSKDNADDLFFDSLGKFPDEFFESIETARAEAVPGAERTEL